MAGLFCWVLERVVRSFPERLRRGRARRFAPSRPGSGAPRPLAREPSSLSLRSCAGSFAPGLILALCPLRLKAGVWHQASASGVRCSQAQRPHFMAGLFIGCGGALSGVSPSAFAGPRASLRSFASRLRRAPPACPRTIQLVASLLRRIVRPGLSDHAPLPN